ncbi:MAG: glycosyltransferase family 39 protein [Bdellovibrionaceae bacterium]|nr:glycosyltransferase family 39 protein [Pseudobdellovibrionaceae bacterium]
MLSYYDHPGMIAWLNWITTRIFGDTIFAIRLPSFIFYSLSLLVYWKLAKELFDEKVAFWGAMLFLWTPFWGFGGYVNSPEPVFVFCWLLASWIFWQGVRDDNKRWSLKKTWIFLGLVMGAGLNSKFIMAMLAFGFGFFLLSDKEYRKMLLSKWPWIGFLIATVLCIPIFVWNINFDWPGFKYQFHDRHTGESFSLMRWLTWFVTQFLFYSPGVYLLMMLSFFYSLFHFKNKKIRFLFLLALPSYLIFYIQPFFADYKPHWSGTASFFVSLIAGYLFYNGFKIKKNQILRPNNKVIKNITIGFLLIVNLFIYLPFIYPFYPKIFRTFSHNKEWNPRYDLSNEFFGWETAGKELRKIQRQFHSEIGNKPFLAAIRYETTAQTIWGTKAEEEIFMLNTFVSHYTVIQSKYHTLDKFLGSNAVVLTTDKYPDNPLEHAKFDSCQKQEFKYYREDELSRVFYFWKCYNFQGITKS